jgi:hypothetical protein
MVSFENGRFILRRRQQPSPQHRLLLRLFPTMKIVIFVAIVIIWGYLINKATDAVVDQDMLRASRDADIPTVVEADRSVVDTPKNQVLQYRQEDDDHDKSAPLQHVLHTFEADQNIEGRGEDEEKNGSKEVGESVDEHENNEEEGSDDGEGEKESGDEPKNQSEGKPVDYSIQLNKEFMEHLQSLDSISKKIHMFFPDKLYFKKEPILPFVSHSIISLINLNRDWNVTVYDDAMVDSVIKNAGDQGIISKEEVAVLIGIEGGDQEGPKQTAHIVERTDIARLLLMYTEGGVYLDVDRLVSKRFDDIFTPSTRLCLPTHFDINFAQDIMCSSRGSELFLSLVQEASKIRMKSERRKGWIKAGTLYDMGPDLYNKQILMKVFGMDSNAYDNHKEDKNFFVQAREAIAVSNGTIITKKESDYCDNTLVLDDTIPGCPGREELYERYSMTPWSEEVDAVWDTEN